MNQEFHRWGLVRYEAAAEKIKILLQQQYSPLSPVFSTWASFVDG